MDQIWTAIAGFNWKDWLSAGASATTILSFLAYRFERRRRRVQRDYVRGFLSGVRPMVESRFQAGEEWRFDVGSGKGSPEAARMYANGAVNDFKKIIEMLHRLAQDLKL